MPQHCVLPQLVSRQLASGGVECGSCPPLPTHLVNVVEQSKYSSRVGSNGGPLLPAVVRRGVFPGNPHSVCRVTHGRDQNDVAPPHCHRFPPLHSQTHTDSEWWSPRHPCPPCDWHRHKKNSKYGKSSPNACSSNEFSHNAERTLLQRSFRVVNDKLLSRPARFKRCDAVHGLILYTAFTHRICLSCHGMSQAKFYRANVIQNSNSSLNVVLFSFASTMLNE